MAVNNSTRPERNVTPKKSNGKFVLIIMIVLFVGIPFFSIKFGTAPSKPAQKSPVSSIRTDSYVPLETDVSSSSNLGGISGNVKYNTRTGLYELSGPVVDAANTLKPGEKTELASFLSNLNQKSGVQIAVLIVPSLNGEAITEFSMRHAEYWKLGQKGVDNGVLLTVAMEEHEVRIETGYGTEGTLTDAYCARIIRNIIVPAFKQNNYGQGIMDACRTMAGIITSDESLVNQKAVKEETDNGTDIGTIIFTLFMIFYISMIFFGITRSRRRGRMGPTVFMGPNIHTNHNSSFGGFSGGGGGFHGGGGGFGGGGASGHW